MFGNHTYLSGITKSLSENFKCVALDVHSRFNPENSKRSILDIGSNDGTQLRHYRDLGWDVLGVESSVTTANIANSAGVKTINEFFNLEMMQRLGKRFDVINAAGVFFHLEELHSVAEGVKFGLSRDGVFIVQFIYMKAIIDNDAFDQIYHEHLLYYTLRTLEHLLRLHGLELFDAYLTSVHGGQMVGFAGHPTVHKKSERLEILERAEDESNVNSIESYHAFARRVMILKERNRAFLYHAKAEGKRIFAMGAPVKGNTLLNFFNIGPSIIECLLEKNPLRKNLYSPGMHIPVLLEDEVGEVPDIYYVLAWNFRREILENNSHLLNAGVQFYFPISPREAT
jgi:2-polyprenyl-3-methyl-5-hydroxy-6-metoxy-1,4-benzoquinol methylase